MSLLKVSSVLLKLIELLNKMFTLKFPDGKSLCKKVLNELESSV